MSVEQLAPVEKRGGRCTQPGCSAATGGACALDLADPLDCEHYEDDGLEPDDTLAGERPDEPADELPTPTSRGRRRLQQSSESVAIHTGEALTLAEASEVLGAHDAAVVVAVGDVGVGKTTLLAALYERLAAGPVGGWAFAGSESLLGFEARSFQATAASGRSDEDTPRTSRATERVALHLSVRHMDETLRHLLLADLSGEHARSLLLYDEPGDYAPLLRSATRVLLLIDGAQLTTMTGQNLNLTNARTLVRAIAEGADLRPDTPVDLVVTKWDQCGTAEGLKNELDELVAAAAEWWSPVELHLTAARPDGQGLEELFKVLTLPRATRSIPTPIRRTSARALHRFVPNTGLARRFAAARK